MVAGTGLASRLVACFGGISIVLASITAALCTGKDAHPDSDKRYVAGMANGVFYLLGATFAGTIVLVLSAFPPALIAAIASNIGLLAQESAIESSVITLLLTMASGMTLFGLGAAFWGVVFGMASHGLLHLRRPVASESGKGPTP